MQYLLNGFDLRRKQTSDSKLHYIPPSEEAETTTKSTRSKIVDSELKRSKAVAKGSKTLEYNLDPIDSFERAVVGDEFETLPALSFTAETEGQRKNLRRAFPEPLPAAQPRQRQVPPASIPLPASIAKQTREAILQYPSRTPPLLAKLNSPPVNSLPVQPNGIYAPAHHPVPPPRPPPPIVVAPSVPIRTTTTMHLTPPTTPRTTLVAAITTRRLAPAYPTTKYAVAPFSLNTVPPITTTRLINEYVQPNATLNGYATISPKSQKILDRLMQGGTDKTRVIDFAGKGETRYVAESVNEISGKPDSIDTDLGGNLEKEEVSLRDTSDRRRKSKKRKRVEDDEDGEDAEDDEDDDDNEKDEDDEDDDDDDENEEYDEDEYTSGYNEGYGVEPKDVGRKNQNLKDKILPIPRPPPGNNYNSRPPPVNTYPSRPPPGNAYPSRPPTGNNYPSRPSSENAYPPGPSTQNSYPEGPPANGLYQTQPPRYDEDGNNEDSYAEAPESVEEIDPEVKKKLKKTKGFLTNGKKKTTPKPKTGKKKTNKDGETEEDYENIDPDDLGDGLDLEDYDGSEDEQTPALRKKGKAKGKKEKKKQPEKKKGKKKEKLKGRKKQKKLNIENEDEEVEEDEYVEEEVEDVEEEIGDEDEEEKQDGEDDEDENKEDEESSLEQPSRRKGKKDKKLGKALKIKKIKPNDVNKKEKKEKKSEKTKKKDKKDKKEKKEKKVKKDKKDKNDKAEKKEKPKKKKGGPAPEEQEEPDDSPRHIVTDDDDIDDEFSNEEDSEEIELREKEDFETPPPLLEKPEPGEKSHIDRNVKTPYSDQKPSKFYYPPKSEVPLPTCFHNPSGYVCCNLMLNNLVEESVEEVKADPDFNMCNIGKIANMIQSKSEEMFEHPFESVVALGDFAQTVHFAGDLVCKLEIDGKYMLVYGTPYDADSIEDQKAIEDGDVKEDSAKKRVRRKKSLPIHSLRM